MLKECSKKFKKIYADFSKVHNNSENKYLFETKIAFVKNRRYISDCKK